MEDYLSDHERAEQLKKWWRDNYKSIIAGIVIAAVIIGGWRWWQHRVQSRSIAASTQYEELSGQLATGQGALALRTGNQIIENYSDTPYAAQAALALAQYEIGSNKPDDAMQMLDWVIRHAKDDSLKLLARLRLARIKLAVGDPQAALTALAGVNAGGFAPLYAELRGDAYAKLGKADDARAAYTQALAQWAPDMGDKSMVQMKLNDLGQAPAAPATPAPAAGSHAGAVHS